MLYENSTKDIIDAQNGNEKIMTKLIEDNNGLIWSIVKRFKDRGYDLEDLYQIGAMGFIKSIKRFDTSFDVKLSTYAVPYILGEIKRFIRDDGSIKISRGIKEQTIKIRELQEKFLKEKGRDISIDEITKELKISKEDVITALDSLNPVVSIYDEIYTSDGTGVNIIDNLKNEKDEAESVTNKITIRNIISKLNNREKQIIMLRYFKNNTQSQVAKVLGISQVQVSRIEKKILEEMKHEICI